MKKTVINRYVLVNAPKQKVWEALADFGNVQNLSPGVRKSYLTSEQLNGVGAERHCDFSAMGAEVEERIVAWNEGESMEIDIYESKKIPMIRGMNAMFQLDEVNGKTKVIGTFSYHMNHLIGDLMNALMMKKVNIKSWNQFMAGIKHHTETGEKVTENTMLNLTSVH